MSTKAVLRDAMSKESHKEAAYNIVNYMDDLQVIYEIKSSVT